MVKKLDERLGGIFSTVFGVHKVDDSTSVESVDGWDSINHITLVLELEREFGITLTTEEVAEITNVPSIKQVLTTRGIRI